MKGKIIVFLLFVYSFSYAQFSEDLVLRLHRATQSEMANITNPQSGMLVYNTTDSKVYYFNGSVWIEANKDSQNIDGSGLSGTDLTIGIENGSNETIDLSSLVDDADADPSNEIQVLSISGSDITLSKGGGTVTLPADVVTNLSQNNSTGVITYINEENSSQTANIISSDADNKMSVGTDGGAFLGATVYTGYFIISSSGNQSVSGLPFQPSQITFVAHANVESLDIDSDNGTGDNDRGIDNSFGTMNGFARQDGGGIIQQVIYIGGSGNSINDISRYASSSNCIGIRYGDQNGSDLGKITASLISFDVNGFTVDVTYTNGTITVNNSNPLRDVQPEDVLNEAIVVLYTAYK